MSLSPNLNAKRSVLPSAMPRPKISEKLSSAVRSWEANISLARPPNSILPLAPVAVAVNLNSLVSLE